MKNISTLVVFLILLTTSLFSQGKIFIETGDKPPKKAYLLKSVLPDVTDWNGGEVFDVTEVPEKWKNESVVVLAYKYQKYVANYKNSTVGLNTWRIRLKLQDKAAVEEYSSLFDNELSQSNFGLKQIKPDGTIIDILEMESVGTGQFSIPNLEVGDIIDYYSKTSGYKYYIRARSQTIVNADEDFPILYKEDQFILGKQVFMKIKTVNEMPSYTEQWYDNNGVECESPTTNPKAKRRFITVIDKDIDRLKDSRYVYYSQVLPHMRYQIFVNRLKYYDFSPSDVEVFTTQGTPLSYKEIGDYVYAKQKAFKLSYRITTLMKTYNPNLVKKADGRTVEQTMDIIKAIHHTVKYLSRPLAKYEANVYYHRTRIMDYDEEKYRFSSLNQIFPLANEMDDFNISYDIIAIVPKNYGLLDELMFEDMLKYGIRVNLPDGNKFFYSGHMVYNDYNVNNYLLEGVEGIVVETKKKRSEDVKFEKVKFPTSSYKDNVNLDKKTITFSEDDIKVLNVENENTYKGILKINESYRILHLHDIFETYLPEYKKTPKGRKALAENRENILKKVNEERIERYKERLEDDYDVKSFDEIEVINTGLKEGVPLVIREKYSLEGLV